jgi:hypothetical protein
MKIYYRISDNSYPKKKLFGTSKRVCLENFVSAFPQDKMLVVADNCKPETVEMVRKVAPSAELVETQLGNAGSFRYCLNDAVTLPHNAFVYFVEDDYLHFNGDSPFHSGDTWTVLQEGLKWHNYVTLFDHPDKYYQYDEAAKRHGEAGHVHRARYSHWRTSVSTCMTFAAHVSVLQQDKEIWDKHTEGPHPNDHAAFCELKEKGRVLGICIPNRAVHTDDKTIPPQYEPWFVAIAEKNVKKIYEESGFGDQWENVQRILTEGNCPLHHRLLVLEITLSLWKEKKNENKLCSNN